MLNFSFIQRVYFLNLFSAIFVDVYHDTPSRNCSCIITLNREKCQIIKSSCWRFQARHKFWNSKRQEIPLSNKGSINAVTKLAVWLQVTVKKNRIDDKNLLHLKYLTCQKLRLFFSVLINISFYRLFCPIPQLRPICSSFEFRSYCEKNWWFWTRRTLKKYGSWFTWLPIRKLRREPNVGPHVSLTLSLQQFYLTVENLKMSYNLKGVPMKALEARSDTGLFG